MGNKHLLFIAILILGGLLVFGWLMLWPEGDDSGIGGAPVKADKTQKEIQIIQAPNTNSDLEEVERIKPTESLKEKAKPQTIAKSQDPSKIKISGTITVSDEFGVDHISESGSFVSELLTGDGGYNERVEVFDGRWFKEVLQGVQRLIVEDIRLGGRVAILEDPDDRDADIPVPESGILALRALWVRPSVLYVKAEDTGLDLDQIVLVSGIEEAGFGVVHPGFYEESNVVLASTRSPINLCESDDDELWWESDIYYARSPGYAWGRITIDPILGGERILMLKRGGELEVTLSGYDPQSHASLRIRPIAQGYQSHILDFVLDMKDVITIDSLAEGCYQVSVEIGNKRDPVVLGTEEVEIFAGQPSQLTLVLKEAPKADTVPLMGTLIIPKAWALDNYYLSIKFLDTPLGGNPDSIALYQRDFTPLTRREDSVSWMWDAGMVQVGTCELRVVPTGYGILLNVPKSGLTGVLIEVPFPEKVSILIIDTKTKVEANIQSLCWNAGGEDNTVYKDDGNGMFEFIAPKGRIDVVIWGNKYQFLEINLIIRPGINNLTIEVERSCGIHVILKDGNTILPWEVKWDVRAEEVDGDGWSSGSSYDSIGLLMTVTKPGRYRFVMPEIEGYLPVLEQEVFVLSGEFIRQIIELQRKN